MITLGIISTIDFNTNECTVRLPIFEGAGNTTTAAAAAIFSIPPGQYNQYIKGDKVVVGFENGCLGRPVILGKIFQGTTTEQSRGNTGTIQMLDLNISHSAKLPTDTSFGDTTFNSINNDIKDLKQFAAINKFASNIETFNTNVRVPIGYWGTGNTQYLLQRKTLTYTFISKLSAGTELKIGTLGGNIQAVSDIKSTLTVGNVIHSNFGQLDILINKITGAIYCTAKSDISAGSKLQVIIEFAYTNS